MHLNWIYINDDDEDDEDDDVAVAETALLCVADDVAKLEEGIEVSIMDTKNESLTKNI